MSRDDKVIDVEDYKVINKKEVNDNSEDSNQYYDRTKEYERNFGSNAKSYTFSSENPIFSLMLIIFIILFAILTLTFC
jgi:hypothetical protein